MPHDIQYDDQGREIGALTLTRKVGEKIRIQVTETDFVDVKLSEVRQGSARLTIVAPKNMAITRPEHQKEAPHDP